MKKEIEERPTIIDGRIIDHYTFATRFRSFLKGVTVNCAMAQEELEYMEIVSERLLKHQIDTATNPSEIDYLRRIHKDC